MNKITIKDITRIGKELREKFYFVKYVRYEARQILRIYVTETATDQDKDEVLKITKNYNYDVSYVIDVLVLERNGGGELVYL